MAFLLVLEKEFSGKAPVHLAALDGKVLAANADYAVYARHHKIHVGVKRGGRCHFTVQKAAERFQQRHDGVDSRHQAYDLVCCDVLEVEVKARLDVFLASGGVECVETYVTHIGLSLGVCYLDTSFLHHQLGCYAFRQQVSVFHVGCIHPDVCVEVCRYDDKRRHNAVRSCCGV